VCLSEGCLTGAQYVCLSEGCMTGAQYVCLSEGCMTGAQKVQVWKPSLQFYSVDL